MIFAFVATRFKAYFKPNAETPLPTLRHTELIMNIKSLEKLAESPFAYEIVRRRAAHERTLALREAWTAVFGR